jgi:hypothetical protein
LFLACGDSKNSGHSDGADVAMNVRMLWLNCAQGLLALSLAGCCCEPVAQRGSCGGVVNGHHAARCGQSGNCGHAGCGRLAGHRPLFHFEQVCPYGFPPYNPAPNGYASGFANVVEVSSSRHVLMVPSVAQPTPTRAPAQLPSAVDENAKRLPADTAVETPVAKDPPKSTPPQTPVVVPQVETPKVETPNAIVQPRHAPRTTEPEVKVDENFEEAPSPNTTEQPVSVPTPDANTGEDDLPENPIQQNVAPPPAVEPTAAEPTVPDAPAPKSDSTDDDEGDATKDSDGDVWPDAPLPKNDLPPLAGPI